MVVQVIFVVFILVISISKDCYAVISFLRVAHGTSISFIDLWDLSGYSVGTKSQDVFRNGVIDSNFTTGCPDKIYFKIFRSPNNNTDFFSLRFHQPFTNNSLAGWLTSTPASCNKPDVDISTITLKITPNEDVILKAYKNNQDDQLYFAVYNPKHLGPGYPKYYVIPEGQGHPSYGTIPGNESLFNVYDHLRITSVYNPECILNDVSQTKTLEEITNILNGYTTPVDTTSSVNSYTTPVDTTTSVKSYTTPMDSTTSVNEYTTPVDSTTTVNSYTTPVDSTSVNSYTTPVDSITSENSYTTPVDSTTSENSYTTPVDSTTSENSYTTPVDSTTSENSYTTPVDSTSSENSYTTPVDSTTVVTSPETTTPASCSDTQGRRYCYYKKSNIGDPTTATASVLWTVTARSSIKCGARCNLNMDICKSFFYIRDTGVCMGLSHIENSDDKPTLANHYYRY